MDRGVSEGLLSELGRDSTSYLERISVGITARAVRGKPSAESRRMSRFSRLGLGVVGRGLGFGLVLFGRVLFGLVGLPRVDHALGVLVCFKLDVWIYIGSHVAGSRGFV